METELSSLLGKDCESPEVLAVIHSFNEEPEVIESDELDLHRGDGLEFWKSGVSITLDEKGKVEAIYLFSGDDIENGYSRYKRSLPYSLAFELRREEVVKLLGNPTHERGPIWVRVLSHRVFVCWDRWDWSNLSLHIAYPEERDRIKKVTLMRPDAVPHN